MKCVYAIRLFIKISNFFSFFFFFFFVVVVVLFFKAVVKSF